MKKFFISLFIILLLLIGGILYVLSTGDLIWKGIKYANEKYLKQYELNLENIDFKWSNQSLTNKTVSLEGNDFCFTVLDNKNCLETLNLKVKFDLLDLMDFKILKIKAHADQLDFRLPTKTESSETSSEIIISEYIELLKKQLHSIPVKDIDIDLDKVFLEQDDSKQELSLKISAIANGLEGHMTYRKPPLFVETPININTGENPSLNLKPKITMDKIELSLELTLDMLPRSYRLDLLIPKFKYTEKYHLKDTHCQSQVNYGDDLIIKCSQGFMSAKVKKQFNFNMNAKIDLDNTIDTKDDSEFLKLNIMGTGHQSNAFDVNLESALSLSFKDGELNYSLQKLDVKAHIERFSEIEKELRKTNFALPAPFNSLEGEVYLTGRLDEKLDFFDFPLKVTLDLGQQKHVQLNGELDLNVKLDKNYSPRSITGNFNLTNLLFHIPDIDPLYGIPELAPSSRIKKEIQFQPKEKSKLHYDIQVQTSKTDSIKIYNQFFEPYLALGANLRIRPGNLKVNIEGNDRSKLVYLKRELKIKKLDLTLSKANTLMDITLMNKVQGYQIFINIVGTASEPRLILTSFPTLPREDIISLLLYRRKSSELASFDQASVGSTQSAISNRALGLFSIWAFASTPIDSVTYNAETNTYNAVVGLPGGASVSIGTNWDQVNNLSFRKRISQTWAVVTTFEPKDTDSKETIMLQKEINF